MDRHRDDTPEDASGVQPMLPLDDDPDAPVAYRLTPKARRLVAPETVPSLHVVAPDTGTVVDLDDPRDPRSSRARALRRGGMSVAGIARQLDVDELVARTWVSGLDVRGRRPRLHAVVPARPEPMASPDAADDRLGRHRAAFASARRAAAEQVGPRLGDPDFVRGLALTVAAAELDEHAVLVAMRDPDVARIVRRWLVVDAAADVASLRAVVRLGRAEGADLALHRWASILQLPAERLARTRWHSAPSADAVEVLLRVPDAAVAARVAGWRDALLRGMDRPDVPSGVGF